MNKENLVRDSDGTLYALLDNGDGFVMYSSTDNGLVWALMDIQNRPCCSQIEGQHMAIASNDIIHIVYRHNTSFDWRVELDSYNTTSNKFSLDDAEQPNTIPPILSVFGFFTIAIDANNAIHLTYAIDTGLNNTYYINKINNTWNQPIQITSETGSGDLTNNQVIIGHPTSSINDDRPIIVLIDNNSTIPFSESYRIHAYYGNALNATSFTDQTVYERDGGYVIPSTNRDSSLIMVQANNGDLMILYNDGNFTDGNYELKSIKHIASNDWTTWESPQIIASGLQGKQVVGGLANSNGVYLIVEDWNYNVPAKLYYYNSTDWDSGTIIYDNLDGFSAVNAKWSKYNNYFANTCIDILYDQFDTVTYDQVSIGTGCFPSPSPAPSGGGGSTTIQSPFDIGVALSILGKSHKLQLGEIDKGQIQFKWDTNQDLQVNEILQKDPIPFKINFDVPKILPANQEGLSEGFIPYTIQVPAKYCSQTVTTNCVDEKVYNIPFEISANLGKQLVRQSTIITIDMLQTTEYSIYILLATTGLGIIGMIRLMKKPAKKRHKK